MRLIDADLVAEKIKAKCNSGQWAEGVVYGMAKALYLVKTAPTVEERPHGECRDRLKEVFREASEIGGDLFHLSQIERIIDGEDWL